MHMHEPTPGISIYPYFKSSLTCYVTCFFGPILHNVVQFIANTILFIQINILKDDIRVYIVIMIYERSDYVGPYHFKDPYSSLKVIRLSSFLS